jgi:Peptidase family M28
MPTRKPKALNPFLFTPLPVTIIATVAYIALIVPLLVIHSVVPSAPRNESPVEGINITEAWGDLQELTRAYRPYNSRRNDEVRDWLLRRVETILEANGIRYSTQKLRAETRGIGNGKAPGKATATGHIVSATSPSAESNHLGEPMGHRRKAVTASDAVTIFDDMLSNVTFSAGGVLVSGLTAGQSVYFEGTNIIIYIRGSEDDDSEWWNNREDLGFTKKPNSKGGVLVNAHYDSVSTGYGATDDGVGVVTTLQMIKYFTTPGNTPKKGLVALLNNGEEDFLNGARAFARHPISQFAHTFLNLEGAGAGGRATLFRSTDTEVTRFYGRSRHPFGTVVSGDGFKRGLIRSQTDYIIFNGVLGLRGLDLAFWEPRARYHTDQDDARHSW